MKMILSATLQVFISKLHVNVNILISETVKLVSKLFNLLVQVSAHSQRSCVTVISIVLFYRI